ncbi:MAG: sulfotransferase [Desulfobacterales bacterium]
MINTIAPNNVLVIGAPRSGTTLVGGLLCAGDRSFPMLPECTYITQIVRHFHDFLHYSDPQRFVAYAIDEATLSGIYARMVQDMLATVLSHFQGMPYQHLILKDPELTLLVDLIPRFFGECSKVVCVVRDPRAVIASMVKVERVKRSAVWRELRQLPNWRTLSGILQQFARERSIADDMFNYYWRVHSSELYKRGAVHIVRYENIVARDEKEFQRLEAFLCFPVGREGFGKVHFDFDRQDATYSENYGKSIQVPTTDFNHILSKQQISKIQHRFAGYNALYKWWSE